jgi:hypothetical protein
MREKENPLFEKKKKKKGRNANAKPRQAPERSGEKKEKLQTGARAVV